MSDVTRVTQVTKSAACGHSVQPGEQFCEQCGHRADAAVEWEITITADREHFEAFGTDTLEFPPEPGRRRARSD